MNDEGANLTSRAKRERLADDSRDSSNGIGKYRGTYLTVTGREGSTADRRPSRRDKLARSRARVRLRLTLFHFSAFDFTRRCDAIRYRTVDSRSERLLYALHVPGDEERPASRAWGRLAGRLRTPVSFAEAPRCLPRSLSTFTYTINPSNRTFFNRATVHPVRLLPPSRLL